MGDPGFRLLPFRFTRRNDGRYLLSNDAGEYVWLDPPQFAGLTTHSLERCDPAYAALKAKQFLYDDDNSPWLDLLAAKYRTKKSFLDGFTKLHIFVTSLRCDQSCGYCQVSRRSQDAATRYDMSPEVMEPAIRLMLSSPAPRLTMEFQGGEPLVNFPLVKEAVARTKVLNTVGKDISFVLCTNLTLLTDEHLAFCEANRILISTSLDGPAELHDRNRPVGTGGGSHALVTRNIRRCQEALGRSAVSALMTTTRDSLNYPKEIVDEYLRMDLGSLFVRELNPYGFAAKSAPAIGYGMSEFLRFYRDVLNYIIDINRQGRTFSEAYTTLVLRKILTPWPVGFVDLQSPSGAGLSVVLYNYDGEVYASDESRMLGEVGDTAFRLGNVLENSYGEIFFGDQMQTIAAAACNESLAGCADCVYQPYCGADPVRQYRTQGDIFGNRAHPEGFCAKNLGIISHLFDLLSDMDPQLENILWAWINEESVDRMVLPQTWGLGDGP